ncbi:MAG: toxin-antitoxin system YwqK family antitoxin [Chitinophagaceae bacterium]
MHDIAYAYYQDSNFNATLATARKGLLYYPERREDWYNLIANALGDEHGLKTVYHLNGNIEKQEKYEYGSLHGVVKTYHENGKLKSEEHYNHGIRVGEHKFYDSNGKLTETRNYYHGVLEKVVKG